MRQGRRFILSCAVLALCLAPSLMAPSASFAAASSATRAKSADAREADNACGLGDVLFLHVVQISPARQQFGIAPAVLQQADGLFR